MSLPKLLNLYRIQLLIVPIDEERGRSDDGDVCHVEILGLVAEQRVDVSGRHVHAVEVVRRENFALLVSVRQVIIRECRLVAGNGAEEGCYWILDIGY